MDGCYTKMKISWRGSAKKYGAGWPSGGAAVGLNTLESGGGEERGGEAELDRRGGISQPSSNTSY